MKYIVVEIINSNLDGCVGHESGLCLCSSGDGTPWVFAKSTILDTMDEAMSLCHELYNERWDELTNGDELLDDWYFAKDGAFSIVIIRNFTKSSYESEFVLKFAVIAVE